MSLVLKRISKQGFEPHTVIDVGVGNGTQELYSAFPSASLFLVEPLLEFEETIQSIMSQRQGGYVIAAAGSSDAVQTINVHENHLEGSSLFNELTSTIDDGEPREISVVTLDGLVDDNDLGNPYLIKVDAQGYELEVMQGALSVLKSTEVVILEVLLTSFLLKIQFFTT